MCYKRVIAGLLTTVLITGAISPAEAVWAKEIEAAEDDAVVFLLPEEATEKNEIKAADADENGFVIENGVLTGYTGDGGDVVIPDGVTCIGDDVFYNNDKNTSVKIQV